MKNRYFKGHGSISPVHQCKSLVLAPLPQSGVPMINENVQ